MLQCNNILNNIVDPVQYNQISFKDNKRRINYTDCFEISLLRFIQSVFIKKDNQSYKIDIDRMKYFMNENKFCKQIIKFFTNNPNIYLDQDHYENDGYPIRTKWCLFLNKRAFFRYKIDDKFELCASLNNLFAFFKVFFPKIYLDQPSFQDKFLILGEALSTPECKIEIDINSKSKSNVNQFYFTDTMVISFNNIKLYNWVIYQYFENINGQVKGRITGHSDLHYCKSYNNEVYENVNVDSDIESDFDFNDEIKV